MIKSKLSHSLPILFKGSISNSISALAGLGALEPASWHQFSVEHPQCCSSLAYGRACPLQSLQERILKTIRRRTPYIHEIKLWTTYSMHTDRHVLSIFGSRADGTIQRSGLPNQPVRFAKLYIRGLGSDVTANHITTTDTTETQPDTTKTPPADGTTEGWCTQKIRFGHLTGWWACAHSTGKVFFWTMGLFPLKLPRPAHSELLGYIGLDFVAVLNVDIF